jgi:hypothetical protein
MKLRKLEWLAAFILMFSLFVALNGLRKLHSLGQPLLGLISEAIFAAAMFSLFNWVRRHGDD